MAIGTLQIDQTPCRASYGLYTPSEFLRRTTAQQKTAVMSNIAATAATGNRLRRFDQSGNSIPQMAAEAYLNVEQLDVELTYIDRPIISYTPAGGVDVRV